MLPRQILYQLSYVSQNHINQAWWYVTASQPSALAHSYGTQYLFPSPLGSFCVCLRQDLMITEVRKTLTSDLTSILS